MDDGDTVFGAFVADGIRQSRGRGYCGSTESFLSQFSDGKLLVYTIPGRNYSVFVGQTSCSTFLNPAGRNVFKLYDDVILKTAKNFRELAMGEQGFRYSNHSFHRMIPKFVIQDGDSTALNGTSIKSIYR